MPDPQCPDCGAPIQHALLADGRHIPLERQEEPTGSPRYRVVQFTTPITVEPLPDRSSMAGFLDHRLDCPAHANGLR